MNYFLKKKSYRIVVFQRSPKSWSLISVHPMHLQLLPKRMAPSELYMHMVVKPRERELEDKDATSMSRPAPAQL